MKKANHEAWRTHLSYLPTTVSTPPDHLKCPRHQSQRVDDVMQVQIRKLGKVLLVILALGSY